MRTYTLRPTGSIPMASRHLLVRPTDAAGATFEIESVRMVSREGAPGRHPRRDGLAGPGGGLPRDARVPRARCAAVRRRASLASAHAAGGRDARAWARCLQGRRQGRLERGGGGRAADGDDAAPVGERERRSRSLRRTEGGAVPGPVGGAGRRARVLGRARDPRGRARGRPRRRAAAGRDLHLGRHAAARSPAVPRLPAADRARARTHGLGRDALRGRGGPGVVDEGLGTLDDDLALSDVDGRAVLQRRPAQLGQHAGRSLPQGRAGRRWPSPRSPSWASSRTCTRGSRSCTRRGRWIAAAGPCA